MTFSEWFEAFYFKFALINCANLTIANYVSKITSNSQKKGAQEIQDKVSTTFYAKTNATNEAVGGIIDDGMF